MEYDFFLRCVIDMMYCVTVCALWESPRPCSESKPFQKRPPATAAAVVDVILSFIISQFCFVANSQPLMAALSSYCVEAQYGISFASVHVLSLQVK